VVTGPFPGGARFAFTIFDDADDGTVANLKPTYDLLASLGMRATRTAWIFRHDGPSPFHACETVEDPEYLRWLKSLQNQGFEIGWHGASFESSRRERTAAGLAEFKRLFGVSPRVHANHAENRENLYWGRERFDLALLRLLYGAASGVPRDHYQGHRPGSPYWWGDLCQRDVIYARNLTFTELNLARINPSMPYRDERRPLVPLWFSASDAPTVREFNDLTEPRRADRLAADGGFTIVATHLGKGFVRDGSIHPTTRRNLEHLASLEGWFPTTGELLDWLREENGERSLPPSERFAMQLRFAADLLKRWLTGSRGK
jgi:hypothetical protein